MDTVGLRELRQNASDLVRRVEAGEQIIVTVSGRASAVLVPVSSARWTSWEPIADLFDGESDPEWEADRDRLDHAIRDPWAR